MCKVDSYLNDILSPSCASRGPDLRVYPVESAVPKTFLSLKQGKGSLPSCVQEISSNELDKQSKYNSEKMAPHKKMSNWACQRGSKFYVFNDGGIDIVNHIRLIFDMITRHMEYPNMLARNNLFHGHIKYHAVSDDVRIIFHAFEYPHDLESDKSRIASEIEPSVSSFSMECKNFKFRNAIYSSKYNCLYLLDYTHHNKKCPGIFVNGFVLDQDQCGDHLFELNYFPKECGNPFLG